MRRLKRSRAVVVLGILGILTSSCGDDDDSVRVRVLDAGVDAAPAPTATLPPVDPAPVITTNPYWHIEHPTDSKRTWMVSPAGARTFVLGVDSVFREDECDGMSTYTHRSADAPAREWKRLTDSYGFNATGAFGALDVPDAPYSIIANPVPRDDERALRDAQGNVLVTGLSAVKVGDPYNPDFPADLRAEFHETIEARAFDKRIQFIYLGHETGMFDLAGPSGGLRDYRHWLWSHCPAGSSAAAPKCVPHALARYLQTRYKTAAALNAAWTTTHASFDAVVTAKPVPYTPSCNDTCGGDLLRFVAEDLLPTWVELVTRYVRAYSIRHVLASPRLAIGEPKTFHFFGAGDTWADSGQPVVGFNPYSLLSRFDAIAVNAYTAAATYDAAWFGDGVRALANASQLPIVVSEMGTRVAVDGWSNKGGADAFVGSSAERAQRYASQLSQIETFPEIVGVFWHAWSDRYRSADPTRQLNIGLFQCDNPTLHLVAGAPWPGLDATFKRANGQGANLR